MAGSRFKLPSYLYENLSDNSDLNDDDNDLGFHEISLKSRRNRRQRRRSLSTGAGERRRTTAASSLSVHDSNVNSPMGSLSRTTTHNNNSVSASTSRPRDSGRTTSASVSDYLSMSDTDESIDALSDFAGTPQPTLPSGKSSSSTRKKSHQSKSKYFVLNSTTPNMNSTSRRRANPGDLLSNASLSRVSTSLSNTSSVSTVSPSQHPLSIQPPKSATSATSQGQRGRTSRSESTKKSADVGTGFSIDDLRERTFSADEDEETESAALKMAITDAVCEMIGVNKLSLTIDEFAGTPTGTTSAGNSVIGGVGGVGGASVSGLSSPMVTGLNVININSTSNVHLVFVLSLRHHCTQWI
ncbi:unnamed protein product [Ambrosiozyma monospora]|uniref:Unnamed protein product n=1 Tax=Ambrosiozyma monospora TaxID=43982 RepID=A0ACB5TGR3_AMBMO|nr:unnamed protein product [Ambrosiozyma monospora]